MYIVTGFLVVIADAKIKGLRIAAFVKQLFLKHVSRKKRRSTAERVVHNIWCDSLLL